MAKPSVSTERLVGVDRQGIDDPDPREGQPLLAGEIGNVLGFPQEETMGASLEESGLEQPGHVILGDGTVGDPARGSLHLDQGLQPVETAGAIPDQLHLSAPDYRLGRDASRDILGADRQGARVPRHVHPGHADTLSESSMASRPSAETRP